MEESLRRNGGGDVPAGLIEKIYESTLEPGRYDELMGLWQDHVETVLSGLPESGAPLDLKSEIHNGQLERHFLRAFAILERLGRSNDDARSVEALIDVNPQPALLVTARGRIVAANAAAERVFATKVGEQIADLDFDVDGTVQLRNALARLADETPARLLAVTRAFAADGAASYVLALTRAQRPDGAEPIGLLSVADLSWTDRIGQIFRQTFGLTDAECEIAAALVAGEAPRQIAESRGRALLTVRTQTKSVLRKVDVRSQSELIRLTAALAQLDLMGNRPALNPSLEATTTMTMQRGNGRALDVVMAGPEKGRPVLFIHGMLDGYGVAGFCREELFRRDIRLIAVVRPQFGNSGPDGAAKGAPERLARDLEAVLDSLAVDRCPVVGHMAGSLYAFAAAAQLGPRITSIVSISGAVPIVSREQFAIMTPRQRIVAYTARFTPTLLPLILRAGIALLDSGGDSAFMRALYETAPVDYRVARTPEVFAILSEGYRFTVAQGHGAFEIDSWHVTRDWTHHVEASKQPVTLIHGSHDPVVRVETVRDFARRYPGRMTLAEIADEGQLVFYAEPRVVLDRIEARLEEFA